MRIKNDIAESHEKQTIRKIRIAQKQSYIKHTAYGKEGNNQAV